jgi:hypothetical protein
VSASARVCLVLAVATQYGIMRLFLRTRGTSSSTCGTPPSRVRGAVVRRCCPGSPRVCSGARVPRPESPLPPLAACCGRGGPHPASDLALQLRDVSIPGIRGSVIRKTRGSPDRDPVRLLRPRVRRHPAGAAALLVVTRSSRSWAVDAREDEIHAFARGAARPAEPARVPPFFRSFFGDGVFAASSLARRVAALALHDRRTAPRRVRPCTAADRGLLPAVLAAFPPDLFFPKMEIERRIAPRRLCHRPAGVHPDQRFLLSFLSESPLRSSPLRPATPAGPWPPRCGDTRRSPPRGGRKPEDAST